MVSDRVAGFAKLFEDCEGGDGGGCAASFAAESCELGGFAGLAVEEGPAGWVEEQRGRHEPAAVLHRRAVGAVACGVVPESPGQSTCDLPGGDTSGFCAAKPGIRQFVEILIGIPDIVTDNQVAI